MPKSKKYSRKTTESRFVDIQGLDCLFWAIHDNDYDKVKSILKKSPYFVNERDDNNNTFLHYIANLPQLNIMIVKELLEYGANINVQNFSHETPLCIASKKNNGLVVLLLQKNSKNTHKSINDEYGLPKSYSDAVKDKKQEKFPKLNSQKNSDNTQTETETEFSLFSDDNPFNPLQNR